MDRDSLKRMIAGKIAAAVREAQDNGHPIYCVPTMLDAADRVITAMEILAKEEYTPQSTWQYWRVQMPDGTVYPEVWAPNEAAAISVAEDGHGLLSAIG